MKDEMVKGLTSKYLLHSLFSHAYITVSNILL